MLIIAKKLIINFKIMTIKNDKLIAKIVNDRKMRMTLAKMSHQYFFGIYFSHYIKYPSAPFHKEIFSLTEDEDIKTAIILAFRGCAKSTIVTLSYPLWAILGNLQKKFIVIIGQTQRQARQHLSNIKRELESNVLLKKDLGPFQEEDNEWGAYSLVLPWYDARISAVSMEQTIRGMRHGEHRPDLIICDDIEDINSVRTKEGRDKIFDWITGEVIPAGNPNTKMVFIGNLLHDDSLLMRFKERIENKELAGIFKQIPLIDDNENIAWPGKYPDMVAIEAEKKKIGSESAFQREYMLRIISDLDRVIKKDYIQYYDELPKENLIATFTGVDLAISEKSTADYTAMVSAKIYGYREKAKIYILPNPINDRLNFIDTVGRIKMLCNILGNSWHNKIFVEKVGYQDSLIQMLKHDGYRVEAFEVHGQDKRSRLTIISHLLQEGRVLFPRNGAELLIQQLVGFGIEKHDDLSDAFAIVVHKSIEKAFNCARIATHKER